MPEIVRQFGESVVAPDGGLDRARMRDLVFRDADAKARLEAILHPLIGKHARDQVAGLQEPYVLLVVPLLLEKNAYRDVVQRVAVVDCSEQTQIERTMRRSRLTETAVRAIMSAQIARADRLAKADDVLNNDGDENALRQQVAVLHERYLALARAFRQQP